MGKKVVRCANCKKKTFRKKYCSINCQYKQNYLRNRNKIIQRSLEYYNANKKKVLKKQIKYKSKRYIQDLSFHYIDNQRKRLAHAFSLKNKSCQLCYSKKNLQRHHPNIKKWNEFIILCKRCHDKT